MPKVIAGHNVARSPGATFVGRGTQWENPFGTGADQVREFYEHVERSPSLQRKIRATLKGRDLVCPCASRRCHAHILIALANDWPLPSWIAQMELAF